MSAIATHCMTEHDARRLTERIRIAAVNFSESRGKLMGLVEEAKAGSAHLALGYESWQAYLADTLGDEPMVIARNDGRPEMVRALTDQGMSTRATAAVMGIGVATVHRDLSTTVPSGTVGPRISHGMDGKTRVHHPRPEPMESSRPRAEPVTAQFTAAIVELNKIMSRLQRISESPNFTKNKNQIATLHGSDLVRTIGELETIAETLN